MLHPHFLVLPPCPGQPSEPPSRSLMPRPGAGPGNAPHPLLDSRTVAEVTPIRRAASTQAQLASATNRLPSRIGAQPSGCRAHKLRTVSSSRTRRHVAHFCSLKAALLCRGCRQRPLGAGLALLPGEDPVRFFEAFLGADVIPEAGHLPGIDGQPLVEPLNEPAGLVRVVSLGYVLLDQRQRGLGIEIKRDAGQGAGRVLRLLLEEGDAPFAVQVDGCLLYTSPSPRDGLLSRMPSSA